MTPSKEEAEWLKQAHEHSAIKIDGSSIFLSLFTPNYAKDPLCALQLGYAIMNNKPIALVVTDGMEVPPVLRKLAFAVKEVSKDDAGGVSEAVKEILKTADDLGLR